MRLQTKQTMRWLLPGFLAASILSQGCGSKSDTESAQAGASAASHSVLSSLPRLEAQGLFFAPERVGSAVLPPPSSTVTIDRGVHLVLEGWAVDPLQKKTAGGLIVALDDKEYTAQYGIPRSDVAAAMKSPSFQESGFTLTLPPASLSPGQHRLVFHVLAGDKRAVYQPYEVVLVVR